MILKKEKDILKIIKKNFILLQKNDFKKNKSKHWNVFSKNFINAFNFEKYWRYFLHNEEGNSNIIMFGKQMDKILQEKDFGKKKYYIRNSIKKELIKEFKGLKKRIGIKFIRNFYEGKIGNPKSLYYEKMLINFRDMKALWHSWKIYKKLRFNLPKEPIILEIGPGVGHLSTKIKKLFPRAKIILIDLPEVNCIQRYYHWKVFPKAKIFDYTSLKKNGLKYFFKEKYDFAILPPSIIKDIKSNSIDLSINIRSMQEMDISTVQNYMTQINRIVKTNGFFYCVNRYMKNSSDCPIKIKEYNFDNYWYFLENQQSWQQPWVHELLAKRTSLQHIKRPKDILSKLHPFDLKRSSSFKDILFVLKNFLCTNDERTYPSSLNVKFKNIYLNLIRRNIE